MQLSNFLNRTLYAVVIQDESGDVYTLSLSEDPNFEILLKYQNSARSTGNLFTTLADANSCLDKFLSLTEEQVKQMLATYWDALYGPFPEGQEHEKLVLNTLQLVEYKTAAPDSSPVVSDVDLALSQDTGVHYLSMNFDTQDYVGNFKWVDSYGNPLPPEWIYAAIDYDGDLYIYSVSKPKLNGLGTWVPLHSTQSKFLCRVDAPDGFYPNSLITRPQPTESIS